MRNPWLDIPLEDYEAHMTLPYVGQAQLLSELFGKAIAEFRPRSVAVLGCAGGNGFERIRAGEVERVVGIDISPDYIERTRTRFNARVPALELFVGDVETDSFPFRPVELVFAGLLFEYLDVGRAMPRIRSMLRPRGTLVTVSQLPSSAAEVTPSPYRSLGTLSSVLRLVSPQTLTELAAASGFEPLDAQIVAALGGKQFHVQAFRAQG
jgi:ubiquinone/menaquinone biosynthesis C-methylase UbiE